MRPGPSNAQLQGDPPVQAARRRAGDLRAARRFAAGLRRAAPVRLAAVFFFRAGLRRVLAFFFAIFAMLLSLFLIAQMVFLPKTNRQYLR